MEGIVSVRQIEGNMISLNIVWNIVRNDKNRLSPNTSNKFVIQYYSQPE